MSSRDSVIAALSTALAAAPGDSGIRLHLASLLLETGKASEALEHYTAVLAQDPVNPEALKGAALAAEQSNEPVRAAGYRRLCVSVCAEQSL